MNKKEKLRAVAELAKEKGYLAKIITNEEGKRVLVVTELIEFVWDEAIKSTKRKK